MNTCGSVVAYFTWQLLATKHVYPRNPYYEKPSFDKGTSGSYPIAVASCCSAWSRRAVVEAIVAEPISLDSAADRHLLNLSCEEAGVFPNLCCWTIRRIRTGHAVSESSTSTTRMRRPSSTWPRDPAGRTGAKARFYLWATALARRASGENQWYTARALHELYNYNDDPVIQAQALKAYRSVLDNFFGSATFFECCCEPGPQRRSGALLHTAERADGR